MQDEKITQTNHQVFTCKFAFKNMNVFENKLAYVKSANHNVNSNFPTDSENNNNILQVKKLD